MRKAVAKTFFILALGVALCACLSFSAYAFAADNPAATKYPATFRFELSLSNIRDYAIEGDSYIFASSEGVTTISGETRNKSGLSAESVDIANGVFYCSYGDVAFSSSDGANWSTCDEPKSSCESKESYITDGSEYLYNLTDDGISIYDLTTDELDRDTLSGFSLMKLCGESLYAIFDDCLYEISGYEATPLEIFYVDYSEAENISTGEASLSSWNEALQNSDVTFKVGTLTHSAFASEIDLASISDETFKVLETFEVTAESSPKAGDQVLILCKTGNAYVVATGLSVYVLKCDDVEYIDEVSVSPAEGEGIVSEPTLCSYLIPVICDAASKDDLDSTDGSLRICGSLKCEDFPFLYCDFYLVSYETDGDTNYGFVPERYVTIGSFDETLAEIDDENFADDNYILTVVLVLIVIALVLFVVGYIVFIATRSKKKKKAGGEDENDENAEDRDRDD